MFKQLFRSPGSPLPGALVLALALGLGACSGGGGGSSKPAAPAKLAFTRNPAIYTRDLSITPNLATAKGAVSLWTVEPALPAGLLLDPDTGVLSGKPTVDAPAITYTISAENKVGIGTLELVLSVVAPPYLALGVSGSDGTVTSFAVDAATGVMRPTGYVLPTTGARTPRDITVHPTLDVVYVANDNDDSLALFDLDRDTGRLVLRSIVTTPGTRPTQIIVHPTADVLYVVSKGAPNLSPFAIDPTTGDVTPIGAGVSVGSNTEAATLNAAGDRLYAAASDDRTLLAFDIDPLTLELQAVGQGVPTGTHPIAIELRPDERFAYVLNLRGDSISVYSLDSASGQPTLLHVHPTGALPTAIAFEPTGRFLYLAVSTDDTLQVLGSDPETGLLAPVTSPVPTSSRPLEIEIDDAGSHLYVSNLGADEISHYSIDPVSGGLTPLSVTRTRRQPKALTFIGSDQPINPRPKFAYVANRLSGDVSTYTTQQFTEFLQLAVGVSTSGLEPRDVLLDPWTRFAFSVNASTNNTSAFTIDPLTGALTAVGTAASGSDPRSAAIEPSGRFLYVAGRASDDLSVFRIDDTAGTLSPVATVPTGSAPIAVVADPTGRYLFVAESGSNTVSAFVIATETGVPTLIGTPRAMAGSPRALAVAPSGRFLRATLEDTNVVESFVIDAQSGALAFVDSRTTGTQPIALALDPFGRFVYTVDYDVGGMGDVSVYSANPTSGGLTFVERVLAGVNPIAAEVSPSGRILYVANETSDDISVFSIHAKTGHLTLTGPPVPAGVAPSAIAVSGTLR